MQLFELKSSFLTHLVRTQVPLSMFICNFIITSIEIKVLNVVTSIYGKQNYKYVISS